MTVLLEHGVESVLGNAMVPLSNACMVTSENCEQPADLNAPARPKHFGTPLALVLYALHQKTPYDAPLPREWPFGVQKAGHAAGHHDYS